ncbi:MAG: MdtA/MuxA family multidrug efflux RND transporter periplasmic adaptor subunit [Verrucomicrobiota bacterium]
MSLPPRRWFLYGSVALVFGVGVWYFGFRTAPVAAGRSGSMGFRMRNSTTAVPVRAVPAQVKNLEVRLRAIGTVIPLNTVTVRSRVEGQLLSIAFQEGQQVEKGQLLAEVDPLPYRIRLAQTEAQLRQNESQVRTAKSDLERFKQLNGQALVTQQQLEAQQALVAERTAMLAADQAQVDDARRQLDYTKIEAPMAGRLGLRLVDIGNVLRPNDQTGLVVLTQTRPIAVMFTVPEIDLQKVLEPMRAGEKLEVEAWDRSEEKMLASGTLKTVDNQIDLTTGTLKLKAEFPNQDDKLFPNQFVNIRLRVQTIKDAVVIPAAAIQYGSRGTYVYMVNEQTQASVRDVVLGPSDGELQSITKGVKPGDRVVLEGLDRLREGRALTLVGDAPQKQLSPEEAAKKAAEKGDGKKGGKRKQT